MKRMRLGIRLHDVKGTTLEEKTENAKCQGFQCVHLALSKVMGDIPSRDGALTPGYAMHVRRLFEHAGLDIAVLGCYQNLAHPDAAAMEKILENYKAHIRFASLLGCGVVGTETGAPNAAYQYEPACRSEEALELLIRNLRQIVDYAEQMGVIIAIEPVAKHIVYSAKRARKVLDEINSPNLQIILDPVNLLDETNYREQDAVVQEAIELLGEDIAVIHLKDFIAQDGRLKAVAAGSGEMHYDRLLAFAENQKPYIQATLEDTTPDNAVAARVFLEECLERIQSPQTITSDGNDNKNEKNEKS